MIPRNPDALHIIESTQTRFGIRISVFRTWVPTNYSIHGNLVYACYTRFGPVGISTDIGILNRILLKKLALYFLKTVKICYSSRFRSLFIGSGSKACPVGLVIDILRVQIRLLFSLIKI